MSLRVPNERRIIAVRTREVRGHVHVTMVKLDDDTQVPADEVVRHIGEHAFHYVMIPPPDTPLYEAYMETGYPVLVQTRPCPDCGEEVLFS